MKTMKKIVAIMAAVLMLCSIIPMAALSVMAADGTAMFDGSAVNNTNQKDMPTWTDPNGIVTIKPDKGGNSNGIKYYTSGSAYRMYPKNTVTITVADGYVIDDVVITTTSSNGMTQAKTKPIENATWSISGTTITLTATSGATSVKFGHDPSLSSGNIRFSKIVVNYSKAGGCIHVYDNCEDIDCNLCTEERTAPGHQWDNCESTTCNNCDATREPLSHTYSSIYATRCAVCGGGSQVAADIPAADSALTILEANDVGALAGSTYTTGKYYVTGVVEKIDNTQYGNLYIMDAEGNKLYVYGVYSPDGQTRYDALGDMQPQVGDEITLYGQLGLYSGAAQMKSGWLYDESYDICEHEFDDDCDADCNLCDYTREVNHDYEIIETTPATCTKEGETVYECANCGHDKTETIPTIPHNFVDGECDVCGAEKPLNATITFDDDKTQRTEFSTTVQKWENEGLTLINNKASSTTNIGDYAGRFYKSSQIIISFPSMTSLVIDANGIGSDYLWTATLDNAGVTYTVADGIYTITFAEPTDSITLTAANQVRANSITAAGVKAEPVCKHEYDNACDVDCNLCGETREVSHTIKHVEAKAATCTTEGNIEYWCCDVCGAAWLDEACTLNTNVKAVVLPASCSYNVVYTAAKAATCTENGNVEYWYCANCDVYYADAACAIVTNAKNVTVAASCKYGAVYTAAKAPTCDEPGNVEYWYCANCDVYYADAACTIITNAKSVILPIAHNVIHVEAVPATCSTEGNIEYWYCADCGAAWLDELCHLNTNLKSVKLPASCSYNVVYTAAKAATCTENGNVEYWYCANCDVYYADAACAIVTNAKNVTVAASCKYGAVYTAAKAATCFEPGNTEYWYCANCDVYYADADCTIITNAKNVILPIAHNIIYVEAKAATCSTDGNLEHWYCADCGQAWLDELCHLNTNLKSVVLPASCSYGAVYTEAKAATCYEPGNTEYWYCANCDVYYADAACAIVTNAKSVILPITHNIIHVEAKAATCTEMGNIEYWYCADCGSAWLDELCHLNTNLKAVVLGATCSTNAVYTEAKAATCFEPGNVEYWYCANCDVYYLDAACTIITNAKSVILPIAHNIIHVEAKAATCTEMGNIEYWYCADCGSAWLDELCHLNTNLKAVVLPMADHTYDGQYDADCNNCGAKRDVVAAGSITFKGNSCTEETETGAGLAFQFTVAADHIDIVGGNQFAGGTITVNGVQYTLIEMGATVSNSKSEIKVPAKYLIDLEGGLVSFAVRVIKIPADQLNTEITAVPYYIYENAEGVQITITGDAQTATYNGVQG